MNRHFDPHFQKEIVTIHPGEYFSTDQDVYISTVLGSCISIALFDVKLNIGGLNHFMLPRTNRQEPLAKDEEGRYGNFAIELLINDMIKRGSKRSTLQAKIFGGSNVLEDTGGTNMTGLKNINFALNFLETERIPIIVNDTGGIFPRKIFFHTKTAKVFLKRIKRTDLTVEQIKSREEAYEEAIKKTQATAGDITWF